MKMANSDKLNEENILASTTVLETLGNSPELIFASGGLFQLSLKVPAHLTCRKFAVSFRVVSNDWFVPRVSRGRKGNFTPKQNVHVIKQAAQDRVKAHLGLTFGVDMQVWEVRPVLVPV